MGRFLTKKPTRKTSSGHARIANEPNLIAFRTTLRKIIKNRKMKRPLAIMCCYLSMCIIQKCGHAVDSTKLFNMIKQFIGGLDETD